MRNLFRAGQTLLGRKQGSILSAAFIILSFLAISRILGLVRYRIFVHFFTDSELAVYLAALRVPETLFEILVAGTLASAFVPVFTSLLSQGEKRRAWYVAGVTQLTLLVAFLLFSVFVLIFAQPISQVLTPGFSSQQQLLMTSLTRFLLIAQIFFLISFFLGGVQETFGRFLVPAIAPLFYNLGMILGAAFLSGFGVWGIAFGAVLGSFIQLAVQLPFAYQLGFRFIGKIDPLNSDFLRIVKLATPRMIEMVVLQIAKGVELFLATTISVASYTHLIFANTLQLVPVAFFGYSIGKATFPTLSSYAARGAKQEFAETVKFALGQVFFFVAPFAVALTVLRIPVVRLVFGAQRFGWEATVQTGLTLSAFSLAVVSQAMIAVLLRSFYALQDTKTPMISSIASLFFNIILSIVLVLVLHIGVWGIALSYSIVSLLQGAVLLLILNRQVLFFQKELIVNLMKIATAAVVSGLVMYFLLKVLDQAAWDKRLSLLDDVGLALPTTFQVFVLDTRYTINLIFLTLLVITAGIFVYLALTTLLRCREVGVLARWITTLSEREVGSSVSRSIGGKSEIPAPLPPGG